MLQNIRDNIQGLMAKFIIGLMIVPFAFFGMQSLLGTGGGQLNVATVNGEEISAAALDLAVSKQRQQLLNMMGGNIDASFLDDVNLRMPALNQLIQKSLLLQLADSASIGVSDAAIDQTIISMPQFQVDGKFDSQLYRNVLRSNGFTLRYN